MEHVSGADRPTVEAVPGVHLTQLAASESMSVQGFRIEPSATVPEHDHHHEQTGYVFAGTLTFTVDGETYPVGPGDAYAIPGGEPHAAANHGEEEVIGVDTFSPPRLNPDWAADDGAGSGTE
jgi:quercetin dioxygenase-like cupin family protein